MERCVNYLKNASSTRTVRVRAPLEALLDPKLTAAPDGEVNSWLAWIWTYFALLARNENVFGISGFEPRI
jgi:hypothetical protein